MQRRLRRARILAPLALVARLVIIFPVFFSLTLVSLVQHDVKSNYERRLKERANDTAAEWQDELYQIGSSNLAKIRALKNSTVQMKIPPPTAAKPATWGAPPTTKDGRKPLFKYARKAEEQGRRRTGSWENRLELNFGKYREVRERRYEAAKVYFHSERVKFPNDDLVAIMEEANEKGGVSAIFTHALDEFSLSVFSTMSVFDEDTLLSTQEVGATNGMDTFTQTNRLLSLLQQCGGIDRVAVAACLYGMVGVVEDEGGGVGERISERSSDFSPPPSPKPAVSPSRRASVDYWKQIETSAVASILGPHNVKSLDLARSFTATVTGQALDHVSTFTTPRQAATPRSKQLDLSVDADIIKGVLTCTGLSRANAELLVSQVRPYGERSERARLTTVRALKHILLTSSPGLHSAHLICELNLHSLTPPCSHCY